MTIIIIQYSQKKESKEGLKQVMIVGSDVDVHADGQSGARSTGGVCGRMVVKRCSCGRVIE
jgi:hypothetical protein